MQLKDQIDDRILNLQDLKADFLTFRDEGYEGETFPKYLADVIDATLRGRNDCGLVNMSSVEAERLRKKIVARWHI